MSSAANPQFSKNSNQGARDREELLRTVANTVPVLIWMSGPDKMCRFCNESWLRFTGRTLEQELGQGWLSGVHQDDLGRSMEAFDAAIEAQVEFEVEYRLRRFDGEYRWVVDRGAPVFESDGTFRGYAGACIDITERKLAEEALIAANEQLVEANQRIEKLKEKLEHENVYLQK